MYLRCPIAFTLIVAIPGVASPEEPQLSSWWATQCELMETQNGPIATAR
jgi:hypothetical protein